MAARQRLLVGDPLVTQIRQDAIAEGDDPNAVLAVASAEGGFSGEVGDSGTSFGPFQLHEGGALPTGLTGSVAAAWANSTQGIRYAVAQLSKYAKGLSGARAVDAIVTYFERPADGGAGDRARAATYLANHPSTGSRNRGGRAGTIKWTGVSTAGVKPTLLASVAAAVEEVGGTTIDVTSGKRAPGPGNDVSDSNHITGDALDGYVIFSDGSRQPLGTALLPVATKYGLRSGDVAGFDPRTPGGYDPVHVDDGANVGGVHQGAGDSNPAAPAGRARTGDGGQGGGDLSWLGGIAGDAETAAEDAFGGVFGVLSSPLDVLKKIVWLMNPRTWLRMVEFLTGMTLMLLGLIGLAVMFLQRNQAVGTAAGIATALPGPAGAAGRAVTAIRAPRTAARQHVQRQRAAGRVRDRQERAEMDHYYRERADELDPRRRARAEQRELRAQDVRERIASARSHAGTRGGSASPVTDDIPFG